MKRFKYLTLAALVAFAACDEADEIIIAPVVTGAISGVVSIEGAGASGVTVTLSSGASATTDGSGAYTFSGVAAGAYTVSISGYASDAAFSSTAKAATISTAGQVATVSFDGSYVRTSAIFGSVAAGGVGLAGVSVGIGSASTTTDVNGQFSFTGLRSGTYTVTISGWDATTYSFGSTTLAVTLGVGESKPATFAGALMTNAMIKGSVFIDENDKDNTYTAGTENKLTVAGLAVGLEIAPTDTVWTVTDAAGDYSFTDLAAGSYKVIFGNPAGTFAAPLSAVLPAMLGANGPNVVGQAVSTGVSATVDFPVDIITQAVKVYGFLGTDADVSTKPGPGITPLTGWSIKLYDTEANATRGLLGAANGQLGATVKTDANGESIIRFARALDISPNSKAIDGVVFAQVAAAPVGTYGMSGETIIEIKYDANDSVSMAPDTFDAIYNELQLKVHVSEIDMDTLAGWTVEVTSRKDTLDASSSVWTDFTDAKGDVVFDMDFTNIMSMRGGLAVTLPDTLWVKIAGFQLGANGHGFTQAPSATDAMAAGQYMRFIWDGTQAEGDVVDMGAVRVRYTDTDITVRMHREADDSTDVPTYTKGDNLTDVNLTAIHLYDEKGVTAWGPTPPAVGTGLMTWLGAPTLHADGTLGRTYTARARSTNGGYSVLNDTIITITLDGSDQTYTDTTLKGGAGNSSFAFKSNNNTITGSVLGRDGVTGAKSVIVTVSPTADNIQGTPTMVDTTSAAGTYAFDGLTNFGKTTLMEGAYTVSVADIAGTWEFFDTLKVAAHAVSGALAGTQAGVNVANTNAYMGGRDLDGYNVAGVVNFQPDYMATKIQGVVVNDRDADFNTLDPDEALPTVTMSLIADTDKDGVVDATETAVLETATTDATGAYSFTALREGFYHVAATSPTDATVLRALSALGAVTSTVSVNTTVTIGAGATLNQSGTRQAGNVSPPAQGDEFPRWNYLTGTADEESGGVACGPNCGVDLINNAFGTGDDLLTTNVANFVHLFNTGTVTGKVMAGTTAVTAVRVTITRCQTAAAAPSPPVAGACTAKHGVPSKHIQNMDTDATGTFTFTGLLEGVYQVDVAPATAGYTNIVTPAAPTTYLATLQGNNDIETTPNFVIS